MSRRQTKLTEKQKQGGNTCENMAMRGKYNENVSGGE